MATPIIESMNDKGALQELCQKRGFKPPIYSSVSSGGAAHCPVFVQKVTVVWEGETVALLGEGPSKKEADKAAARTMLERIRTDKECEDPYNEPVTSPSQFKVSLSELLQKNQLPLPQYELVSTKGPPHKREFTVKCTINGAKALEQFGYGSTKKLAESDAASKMLSLLYNEQREHEERRPRAKAAAGTSGPNVLSDCDVEYNDMTGEDGVFLCLASTNTITAHGMSIDSKEHAQEIAFNNLNTSFVELLA